MNNDASGGAASVPEEVDYDVIVVGACFAGLNALYRFRAAGFNVHSSWLGANIPGKPRRPVTYIGGFVEYKRHAEEAIGNLRDFVLDAATPETATIS